MKTKALMVIVFLLLCSAILASGNDSEAEEYWRKTQELNRRADQFKAETGFVGDIGYSYQAMDFNNYRGNFRDIPITAPQDTVAMGQVFEHVLTKVKPYIRAREGQLFREAIVSHINSTFVTYRQRVNGYGIDGAGVLNIDYNIPTNEIVVTDNTVDIGSEIVQVNITEDQAIDAVLQYYDTNEDFDRDHWMFRRHIRLAYAPIEYDTGIVDYKLCYLISHGGGQNYVDPSTGEVIYTRIVRIANDDCYVTGDIYESTCTSNNILQLPNCTLPNIKVMTDNYVGYTDASGFVAITDSTYNDLTIEFDYVQKLSLCEYPDTLQIVKADSSNILIAGNIIRAHFPDNQCNSTNIYSHILDQFIALNSMSSVSNSFGWGIISNSQISDFGYCDPNNWKIHIRNDIGQYSHVARHELSHAFIYDKLNCAYFHNTDNSKRAMDEAFAVYFPCSVLNTSLYINSPYPPNNVNDITHYSVLDVLANFPIEYPGVVLSEDFFQEYFCRYPIASAWWAIRDSLGASAFDQDLIRAVRLIAQTRLDSLRYKPRYFYNILMRNSTPSNQLIIERAYSDRGLNFTPQVVSAGVSNPPDGRDKNMFRIGDPVYVKVTNCPQNIPLTVYVVEDQDYTDGMMVSSLNALYQVSGTSDPDGVWCSSTPVMTASTVGDYDILVDIGNNGVLHFAYSGANVHDGFDGLNGSGFTVYDDGVDVVLALDVSESMEGECGNLRQLARSFISAMLPGDRLSIFLFNEGTHLYQLM